MSIKERWRLIRFGKLLGNIVAIHDKEKNILFVDKAKYDLLPEWQQSQVLFTNGTILKVEEEKKEQKENAPRASKRTH